MRSASRSIELGHAQAAPPATLYHGTVERFLPSIRERGLVRGQRHHAAADCGRSLHRRSWWTPPAGYPEWAARATW
jgi:hypothetical protein